MTTRRMLSRGKPPSTVSEFVKLTRFELREQKELVHAKLDLIDRLAKAKKYEKLDLLFGLIDLEQRGAVDVRELTKMLRSRNQLLLSDESINRALRTVKAIDEDVIVDLDRNEFELFFQSMVQHLTIDFDELAEYFSLKLSFAAAEPRSVTATDRARDDFGEYKEESESTSMSESESSSSFHHADDEPAAPPNRFATPRCARGPAPKSSGKAATSALRRQPSEWSLEYDNRELVSLSPTPATIRLSDGSASGRAVQASGGRRAASGATASGALGKSHSSRASTVTLSSSSCH